MVARVHYQPVRYEQQIEFAAFGGAGDFLDDRQLVVAGGGSIVTPAGGMVAGAKNEDAQMHLTFVHATLLPPGVAGSCRCGTQSGSAGSMRDQKWRKIARHRWQFRVCTRQAATPDMPRQA